MIGFGIVMEEIVNKEMTINEVIEIDEDLADVFFAFGMFCIGCASAAGETVEEACQVHDIDVDELVKALNIALNK